MSQILQHQLIYLLFQNKNYIKSDNASCKQKQGVFFCFNLNYSEILNFLQEPVDGNRGESYHSTAFKTTKLFNERGSMMTFDILIKNGEILEDFDPERGIERFEDIDGKRYRFYHKKGLLDDLSGVNCLCDRSYYSCDGKMNIRFGNLTDDNVQEILNKAFSNHMKLNLMDNELTFEVKQISSDEEIGNEPYLLIQKVDEDDDCFRGNHFSNPFPVPMNSPTPNIFNTTPAEQLPFH